MTIFVSQRPNRDPEPWLYLDGCREYQPTHLDETDPDHCSARLAPRPEYTQTNDPEPWVYGNQDTRVDFEQGIELQQNEFAIEWSPRHDEFDPPVNRILADFREVNQGRILAVYPTTASLADAWVGILADPLSIIKAGTRAERAHALRALTLLANLDITKEN